MKAGKIMLFIAVLLLPIPLFAGNFMLGGAATGSVNGDESYGGLTLNTGWSFFEEPYLTVSANVTLSPWFESAGMRLSTAPLIMTEHPFDALFVNSTIWAPKLSLGGDYVMDSGCVWTLEISPFNFRDTDFAYEFLAPGITFSRDFSQVGYSVTVLRVTKLF